MEGRAPGSRSRFLRRKAMCEGLGGEFWVVTWWIHVISTARGLVFPDFKGSDGVILHAGSVGSHRLGLMGREWSGHRV